MSRNFDRLLTVPGGSSDVVFSLGLSLATTTRPASAKGWLVEGVLTDDVNRRASLIDGVAIAQGPRFTPLVQPTRITFQKSNATMARRVPG